jgi:antitoxin ParD1/3/4
VAELERLTVTLPSDMAAVVRSAVEDGDYASSSEVIREALREWKLRRSLMLQELDELRRLWNEGIAGGPGRFGSIDEIKAEARRRFNARSTEGGA